MKKKNLHLFSAIAVGVVIIAATGYGVWKMNKDIDNAIVNIEQNAENIKNNETSDWKTYRNEEYGFELKYPAYLNLIYNKENKNISITNIQEEAQEFRAHEDGEIWIDIYNIGSKKVDVFNKIGQVEKNYSYQLGNTTDCYYNFELLNFDAVMNDLEYSNSELFLNPGIFKTLYFKNNNIINIISAHIPNKNKKQIELFDEILKTIKLID